MRVERANGPIIVGSGVAGLATAIACFPAPCLVVTGGAVGELTSTRLAQGGLAAAVGSDDSTELHLRDTLAAGAGLCDEDAVRAIIEAGPAAVDWLERVGVRFDTMPDGQLSRGLEGAHSRRRVLHIGGDASGSGLLAVLARVARDLPTVEIREQTRVLRVLTCDGAVTGVLVERDGDRHVLAGSRVVLATGGVGGLFAHTTNPLGSRGQGLALAARAGASLQDLEMVQFHPTALDVGLDPMPLVSEAVRGEGAVLVNDRGETFVDSLAARDVVSRAAWAELTAGRRVLLDARHLRDFAAHFPQIDGLCRAAGLDPRREPLPVRPAAHYHMGGIAAGLDGATDVIGLHAVGECSSTGLHGANRLASNSLLEAVVCARWTAGSVADPAPVEPRTALAAALAARPRFGNSVPLVLRERVEGAVGISRQAATLQRLRDQLVRSLDHDDALVAHLMAHAALARPESRGGQHRTDHPQTLPIARHTSVRLSELEPVS